MVLLKRRCLMSLLKNYNIRSKGYITDVIRLLAVVVVAYIVSKVILNTILFLVLISSVFFLYLFLKDNLSFFFLALYGLLIGIPWGRTGQSQGRLGWGSPSGAIFGIRIEYTHILILFFLFFIAIKIILKERERLIRVPNSQYFIIFVVIGTISAILGLNPEEGLSYFLKYVTIPMVSGFLMAFWVINSERSFKMLTWGIMLLTTLISLYALYEFITNKNPIEIFVLEHLPIAPNETIDAYKNIKSNTYQSNATLGNPILAAFVLMAGFMISAGYYIYYSQVQRSRKSIVVLFMLITNFSAIIVTFSRGVLFSSIIALFIFILPYMKNIRRVIFLISPILIIIVCFIQFGLVHYTQFDILSRFDPKYILTSESLEHRVNAYSATYHVLKSAPFFGSGFISTDKMINYIPATVLLYIKTLDNTFLEILSFSGIIGFICFILLLLKSISSIHCSLKKLKCLKTYPVLYAMYCSILGMLIASLEFWFLGQLTCSLTFWTFIGILTSITLTDIKYRFERL